MACSARSIDSSMDALTASGRYPAFTRTVTDCADGYDLDLDALFEFGPRPLLDGMRTWSGGRRGARSPG